MTPSRYMVDITDQTYGRLVVTRFVGRTPRGKVFWEAECACGNKVLVQPGDLRGGGTRSCGCLQAEGTVKRNRAGEKPSKGLRQREYNSWISAKRRCLDLTDKDFHRYGAVGVAFSAAWAESFDAFYDHMGARPPNTTLDRLDNAKGYEPGNCRWATPKEQAINRKSTRYFTVCGGRMTTEEAAHHFGVTPASIFKRVREKGTLDGYHPRGAR